MLLVCGRRALGIVHDRNGFALVEDHRVYLWVFCVVLRGSTAPSSSLYVPVWTFHQTPRPRRVGAVLAVLVKRDELGSDATRTLPNTA